MNIKKFSVAVCLAVAMALLTLSSCGKGRNSECKHKVVTDERVMATCTSTGLTRGSHCAKCGEVLVAQKVIPISGIHVPSDAVEENKTEPTCSTSGSCEKVVYCSLCGEEISRTNAKLPAKSHQYKNNVCVICGAPVASVGLSFTSNGDGTCYVSGIGSCTSENIVIPETSPEGDIVTAIGEEAFYSTIGLFSIRIPDTVVSIKDRAFYYCLNLQSITLPSGLSELGNGAFIMCDAIKDSCNEYKGIYYLGSADNPYLLLMGPKDISKTTYDINENTVFIKNHAFSECKSLTSMVIPDSVKSIGGSLFQNCSELKSVKLPKDLTVIESNTFFFCEKLESIDIPDGVTRIGQMAFFGCKALTSVRLPEKVVSIEEGVFTHCTSLENVTLPSTLSELGNDVFKNCSKLRSVKIPENIKVISDGLFSGCSALESIALPSDITSIGSYAFSKCIALKSVVIPAKVNYIDTDAFMYSMALSSVEFENTAGWRYYSLISDKVGTELDVTDPSENAKRLISSNLGYCWKR